MKISINEFFKALDDGNQIIFDYDSDRLSELEADNCEFYRNGDILLLKEFEGELYTAYAWLTRDVCFEETFSEYLNDAKCERLGVSACGFLPSEITKYLGGLAFKKKAERCDDEQVVSLGERDVPKILAFCDKLMKGSFFDEDEGGTFKEIVEDNMLATTLGIYDGDVLAGMVFYRSVPEKRLGVLSEIAVLPEYRGRGFGKRLVDKALGANAGYDHIYTCHKQNYRSLALAEKCGFEFCGVKNIRVKTKN